MGLVGGGGAGEKDDADAFDSALSLHSWGITNVTATCDGLLSAEPEAQEAQILKSEVEIYLGRQYLGIPATSASCERVFSTSGRIFGPENQHMSGEKLSERMWAKNNKP